MQLREPSTARSIARRGVLDAAPRCPDWLEYDAAAWAVEETIDRVTPEGA